MSDKDTIEWDFSAWQKLRDGIAKLAKIMKVASIVTGLGWLLFLYKMSQTSEMALRYSTDAHESIGIWVVVLALMTVFCFFLLSVSGKAKKQMKELSTRLTADIRNQLEGADEGLRSKLESQLRELGA